MFQSLWEGRSSSMSLTARQARVLACSDAELLYHYTHLSNIRVVLDDVWLPLIEQELMRRGLITTN